MLKIFTKHLELKKEIASLKKQLEAQEIACAEITRQRDGYRDKLNEKQKDVYGPIDKERDKLTPPFIDFSNIDCFSIERTNVGDQNERTVVGYWKKENDGKSCKEWNLGISRKQHKELVEQFKSFKGVS